MALPMPPPAFMARWKSNPLTNPHSLSLMVLLFLWIEPWHIMAESVVVLTCKFRQVPQTTILSHFQLSEKYVRLNYWTLTMYKHSANYLKVLFHLISLSDSHPWSRLVHSCYYHHLIVQRYLLATIISPVLPFGIADWDPGPSGVNLDGTWMVCEALTERVRTTVSAIEGFLPPLLPRSWH